MLYLHSLKEGEEIFKALSTPVRLKIMELICEDPHMSMNDLAEALQITNSAVSMHVKQLEEAGLITIHTASGKRGIMKQIRPKYSRMIVDMDAGTGNAEKFYQDEIEIGHFSVADIHPTCGLATPSTLIGEVDNPKVFTFPDRFKAEILWFGYGSVTYTLPNRLRAGQRLTELQISFEISSECPEYKEDYPSDIHFILNDTELGVWISPGDFGERRGILSPNWWPDVLNQYGLLKTLIINSAGTFMDGSLKLSNITIDDLGIDYNSNIDLTFAVPKDTPNCGGLTLFGENFGDYSQNIRMKLYYEDSDTADKN